jgi:hypothetical protein
VRAVAGERLARAKDRPGHGGGLSAGADRVGEAPAGSAREVRRAVRDMAWFKTCRFKVTPEIDKALTVKGFFVLGVTLT